MVRDTVPRLSAAINKNERLTTRYTGKSAQTLTDKR